MTLCQLPMSRLPDGAKFAGYDARLAEVGSGGHASRNPGTHFRIVNSLVAASTSC